MNVRHALVVSVWILVLGIGSLQPLAAQTVQDETTMLKSQWANLPDGTNWERFAKKAIEETGRDMTAAEPSDIASYCPNYVSLGAADRNSFWVAFLAALAQAESKNSPTKTVWNLYDGDAGRPTFRRGLFQISIESANRKAYRCGIRRAEDLTLPQANISCAVRILSHLLLKDRAIAEHTPSGWRGGARYWKALRVSRKRNAIETMTGAIPICAVK